MTDKWLVIFCDPDPLTDTATPMDKFIYRVLTTFLKPGFRHCYAMRRGHYFQGWMVLNTSSDRTHVLEVPDSQPVDMGGVTFDSYTDLVDAAEQAGVATIVTVAEQPARHCRIRSHFNCVTSVKHLLGFKNPGVFTPWRLYRHLKSFTRET